MTDDLKAAEDAARLFHETYERLAPEFGYETRADSAVPWEQVPEKNRLLMTAVAAEVRDAIIARRDAETRAVWLDMLDAATVMTADGVVFAKFLDGEPLSEVRARRDAEVAALTAYVQHRDDCYGAGHRALVAGRVTTCVCGLDAALAPFMKEAGQ